MSGVEFTLREGETRAQAERRWIGETAGLVSVLWEPRPEGVFLSGEATEAMHALFAELDSKPAWVPLFADKVDWAVTHELLEERKRQRDLGYTAEHDDANGSHWHLVSETVDRLTHMGEVSSPDAVRHTMLVGAALLVAGVEALDRQVAAIEALPVEQAREEIVCSQCGKHRTNEPDYSPLQAMMGKPLGWYSGDDGEICPKDIAALMTTSNRGFQYVGWTEGDE